MKLSNGVDLGPKIKFCMHGDDEGGWPTYEGWNGGRWNGWQNTKPLIDGLYSVGWGLCWDDIES